MNPYDSNPFQNRTPATPARETRSEYHANRTLRDGVNAKLGMFNAALDIIARRERATR